MARRRQHANNTKPRMKNGFNEVEKVCAGKSTPTSAVIGEDVAWKLDREAVPWAHATLPLQEGIRVMGQAELAVRFLVPRWVAELPGHRSPAARAALTPSAQQLRSPLSGALWATQPPHPGPAQAAAQGATGAPASQAPVRLHQVAHGLLYRSA